MLFKDIDKAYHDFMFLDFPVDETCDIELKTNANNPRLTCTANMNKNGKITEQLKFQHSYNDLNVEFKYKPVDSNFTFELTQKVPRFPHFRAGIFINEGRSESLLNSCSILGQYCTPAVDSKTNIYPISQTLDSSCVFTLRNIGYWAMGGSIFYKLGCIKNSKFEMGSSFRMQDKYNNEYTLVAKCMLQGNYLKSIASNIHITSNSVKPSTQFGAGVNFTKATGKMQLTFGGLWNLDPLGRTKLKAKYNNTDITLALSHRISDAMTAIVGIQQSLYSEKGPIKPNFGFSFKVCG